MTSSAQHGASPLNRRRIVLAHLSLLHLPPPSFVSIAAAAGFDGVTLRLLPAHPQAGESQYPMLGASSMLAETLSRLDETGTFVNDIEVIRLKPDTDPLAYSDLFEAGARLKANYVVTISDDSNHVRTADNLARLAESAASFGLKTGFEFMKYSGVKTLQEADRLIDATGRSDIVLLIDPLHLSRSGGTPAEVRSIDPGRLAYLQFCDAPAEPVVAINVEGRRNRLLPGAGDLPLRELLSAMPPLADLSVECPVAELLDHLPDEEVARRTFEATLPYTRLPGGSVRAPLSR